MPLRFLWVVCLVACAGDDEVDEPLVVDAVEVTSTGDGFTVNLRWDASGGDDMLLGSGIPYTADVSLFDGATEVTDRVASEPDRYQLFVTGQGIAGPASASDPVLLEHAYADDDLGLANLLDPLVAGEAELVLTLQDLGDDGKDPGLAETVKAEGLEALPGTTVVTATYPVLVL